jgi:hypothetical protein
VVNQLFMARDHLPMTRIALLFTIAAAAAAAAHAEVVAPPLDLRGADSDDAAFQAWAQKWARADHRTIVAWGRAQLDDDGRPERWARLCADDDVARDEDPGATYLIEDVAPRRWKLFVRLDRTPCADRVDGPQPWSTATPRTIDVYNAYHDGDETTRVALRGGAPAIVIHEAYDRARSKETSPFRETWATTDYDRLVIERRYYEGDKASRVTHAAIILLDGGAQRVAIAGSDAPLVIELHHDEQTLTLTLSISVVPPRAGIFGVCLGRLKLQRQAAGSATFTFAHFGSLLPDESVAFVASFQGRGISASTAPQDRGLIVPTRYPEPPALEEVH